jgi:hypothetical protein
MENSSTGFAAPMIASGGIFLAAGNGRTSFISVRDIAEVAATVFQEKRFGANPRSPPIDPRIEALLQKSQYLCCFCKSPK